MMVDIYPSLMQVAVLTILTSLAVVVFCIGSAWWLMWKVQSTQHSERTTQFSVTSDYLDKPTLTGTST